MDQNKVTNAAIEAVYVHQFNTNKAARHVCASVPGITHENAVLVVKKVAKATKH